MKEVFSYLGIHSNKMKMAILSIMGSVLFGIIPYFVVYKIINSFIGLEKRALSYYFLLVLLTGTVLLVKEYLYVRGLIYSHDCAYSMLMEMRKALAVKINNMPLGRIQEKGLGAYKKLFADDIESIEGILGHAVPEGIPYILHTILVLICLMFIDWRMGFLVLAAILIGVIPMSIMIAKTKDKVKNYYQAERYMNKSIIEYVEGMEVIKTFNRVHNSYKKYESSINDCKNKTLDMKRINWKYSAFMYAFLPTTILLALPFGIYFVMSDSLNLSTLLLCIMLSLSIGPSLMKITEFMSSISVVKNKTDEFMKAMKSEELQTISHGIKPDSYDVEFSNVSFAYKHNYVAKNINFRANANEVTAIVGKSGSGKSTLAKLLVRFWEINSGKISIGGVDIDKISQEDLMSLVSFVSQDAFLFNIPIMENIRLGNPNASDDEVLEAAKIAGCHEFIINTQEGYQTRPGNSGDRLSGGEKQRITIARAILKNAPIIVLDEATSSTDPENEYKIQEAINGLVKNKTLIVIAHRLSTIVDADKIILVDKGEISMSGTHHRLVKNSKIYMALWEAHKNSLGWDIKTKEGVGC